MKKLMIAAAAAAMIVGVQAATCVTGKDPCGEELEGAGTAHKVAISLKTTQVKGKTARASKCDDPECTYWREQKTKKINGLIWEQLDDCSGCVPFGANSAFWTNDEGLDVEFAIGVGLIGKGTDSKKIEAYGTLSGDEFGELAWAGFGSMASSVTGKTKCDDGECTMYVKSISGGIAGQLVPEDWDNVCKECDPIVYDGCCDDMQLANTAAYGTIKISYDKKTAKKVALAEDDQDVASFYKLPKAVGSDDIVVNEVVIEE